MLTTSTYLAALYKDTYHALIALPVLMAIALSILTLNAFIRKRFDDVRSDLRELADRSATTLAQVTGEISLYQTGVDYLRVSTFNTMRAYTPGHLRFGMRRAKLDQKESWVRGIGTAAKKRHLKSFYYIIGLSKNDGHCNDMLDFAYGTIVKLIEVMRGDWPQVEIRYVSFFAEDVTGWGSGLSFLTARHSYFVAGPSRVRWATPPCLQHAWFWRDDAVTTDLAERISDWFDEFALPKSRMLWAPLVTGYAVGRADCNAHFAQLASSSLSSQQAEALLLQLPIP